MNVCDIRDLIDDLIDSRLSLAPAAQDPKPVTPKPDNLVKWLGIPLQYIPASSRPHLNDSVGLESPHRFALLDSVTPGCKSSYLPFPLCW